MTSGAKISVASALHQTTSASRAVPPSPTSAAIPNAYVVGAYALARSPFSFRRRAVNVTVVGKHFVLTPTHTGTQPASFTRGGKEVRPLGEEIDAAFKLIAALDDKQRAQAVIGDRPQGELLLGPGRDGRKVEPKGIKGSTLTPGQQGLLLDVIGAWVNMVEPDAAAARMAAIREKIGDTYFAWSGQTEKGRAASFRVQGPAVVIEYVPQGGTDHIHTVIRNPEDDYGAAELKR